MLYAINYNIFRKITWLMFKFLNCYASYMQYAMQTVKNTHAKMLSFLCAHSAFVLVL